jgi:hypothetical protein
MSGFAPSVKINMLVAGQDYRVIAGSFSLQRQSDCGAMLMKANAFDCGR